MDTTLHDGGQYLEELQHGDLVMQQITPIDWKLITIDGNTIHQNDGLHLNGKIGVSEDRKWQCMFRHVVSCKLVLYDLPNGHWANQFLTLQTELFCQV